jgi:hypothetical protein
MTLYLVPVLLLKSVFERLGALRNSSPEAYGLSKSEETLTRRGRHNANIKCLQDLQHFALKLQDIDHRINSSYGSYIAQTA